MPSRNCASHRKLPPVLTVLTAMLIPVAMVALASPAQAAEQYTYQLSLLGGIGGSPDPERGDSFGNTGVQVEFSMVRDLGTLVSLRAGKLDLDDEEFFGSLGEATLEYGVIGGEYLFNEDYYVSGIFLGVGAYRLQGVRGGRDTDETSLGGTLAVSGEFAMTRALAIRVEVAGHYADLDTAQLFGTAHAGLSLRF